MPPAALLPLFSTPPVSTGVTSFPGRARPFRSGLLPHVVHLLSFSTPLKQSYRLPFCLSLSSAGVYWCHCNVFTRDCGEWGLDCALSLFACRPLPRPCPSWVGIDVLLRGNMVNTLMQSLWHLEKWDNTIILFFALQSLVVCVTYRKTLWISSCLYQMSEDTIGACLQDTNLCENGLWGFYCALL